MAITNNAHSDLIHLFIDGEATETERNILFGALKDSPELQEEFSSAMQLKQAFASDISKLQPPSYLQSKIAERAGLIIAASSSVATAPVVVNSISNSITSALTTAAPAAATGISKGLMTLLIGTTVGVLSTIGVIQMTKESPKAIDSRLSIVDSRNNDVPQPGDNQSAPMDRQPLTANSQSSTIDYRPSTIDNNTLRSAVPLQGLHSHKGSLNEKGSAISEKKNEPNANTAVTPSQEETHNTINTNTPGSPAAMENIAVESAMPPIAMATPMIPAVKNIGRAESNRSPLYDGSEGFYSEPDWLAHMTVSVQTIPTGSSKLFQGGKDNAEVPPWNNYGWSLKYEIDPFSAIALEGGLETFPVYLVNNEGGFTGYHSIGWGGASFTYSFPLVEFLGFHPEARALAGISTAGPIAKVSAGLVFQPGGPFSISVDPEYTALFIKENGAIRAGSKIGVTYSARFHF